MSAEQNKALVRRWLEELDRDAADPGALETLMEQWMTPDFRVHVPGGPALLNRDGYRQFAAAFPDMQHEIHFQVAEGDLVVSYITLRATHRGMFQGVPPTGRQVAATEIVAYRVTEGRIAEEWFVGDSAALLQQLGAIPAPVQATG